MEEHGEPLVGSSLLAPSKLSISALDADTEGKVAKEIKACMRVIAAGADGSGQGPSHEGYLLKKKRKSDSWRKYWAVLDASGNFHYHRGSKVDLPARPSFVRCQLCTANFCAPSYVYLALHPN